MNQSAPRLVFLAAGDEIAFEHDADDCAFAVPNLVGDIPSHGDLGGGLFAAIAVTAIDEHDRRGRRFLEQSHGSLDGGAVKIWSGATAPAQYEMTFRVAGGAEDRGCAFAGEGRKRVGMLGGHNGINRDLQITVGAIFKTDWHREAGSEFAMNLAFGRAGADGGPSYEVRIILSKGGIEKFRADGQA